MHEFDSSIAEDADIQTLQIEQVQKIFFPALCFVAFNEATLNPGQQVVFLREIATNLKKLEDMLI
jgi:hypothetical protein